MDLVSGVRRGCGSSRPLALRRRGEVVAATRAMASRSRDLDQILVAIDQEMGPVEMHCQPEEVVEPLDEHALGFQRLIGEECSRSSAPGLSSCDISRLISLVLRFPWPETIQLRYM